MVCRKETEPARRARVQEQAGGSADAIRRTRHRYRLNRTVWGLAGEVAAARGREPDREPVGAGEEAAAGSNTIFIQSIREVISCRVLTEQGPRGPVP